MPETEVQYQILTVTGTFKKHSVVSRMEHLRPDSDEVIQEFWGAFLPDGRLVAIDGRLTQSSAQVVYKELCKVTPLVQ